MKYKFLFFDIDDTLWNCKANSITTFLELFDHFNIIEINSGNVKGFYQYYNDILSELLLQYQYGKINKQQLRIERMKRSLIAFKVKSYHLAEIISDAFIKYCLQKRKYFQIPMKF